jgi:hypothetical protein
LMFKRFSELEALEHFDPIHLNEMKSVELMNRVDTKFVFRRSILADILVDLSDGYKVLDIEGVRMNSYSTQYFDSEGYRFYLDHHNGKGKRYKVRIRNYKNSGLYFLEVKNKWKGRTKKSRIRVADFEDELSKGSTEFVTAAIGTEMDLKSKFWNRFDRITLVNKLEKERLTLDVNLGFKINDYHEFYDHFVVAELKQERINRNSLFYQLMKKNGIRNNSFSKYCIGAISINSDLKYNRFKRHLRLIDKLKN